MFYKLCEKVVLGRTFIKKASGLFQVNKHGGFIEQGIHNQNQKILTNDLKYLTYLNFSFPNAYGKDC
jgi:hypothetical protein